jgi:predicted DNA-binding transcriptional regulator AlpA
MSEATMAAPARKRLLSLAEVSAMVGASRPAILRWARLGTFPAPIVFGGDGRAVKRWWRPADIEAVLDGTWTSTKAKTTAKAHGR